MRMFANAREEGIFFILARRMNAPFFGKRFTGDWRSMTLHDLDNEKPECKIEEIDRYKIAMFEWVKNAEDLGFKPCRHCWTAS
jgi:hypothetical protein